MRTIIVVSDDMLVPQYRESINPFHICFSSDFEVKFCEDDILYFC